MSLDKKTIIILFLTLLLLTIIFLTHNLYQDKVFLEQEIINLNEHSTKTINQKNSEINELQKNLSQTNQEKENLTTQLTNKTNAYNELKNSNETLTQDYNQLKQEVNTTIQKIIDYEQNIQESMEWFTNNSTLTNKQQNLILNLKANCLKKNENKCEINLACISLINDKFQNFSYQPDTKTTKQEDKLQSIEQFVKNKGGDCEDYALIYKAEYNALTKECETTNLASYANQQNSRFWLNNNETWYIDNTKKIILEQGFNWPSIVCGNIYDLQTEQINGHCVIVFTKKKLSVIEDIKELSGSLLVEPQTGKYLGKIGLDSNISVVSIYTKPSDSFINVVITDNDFFLYSFQKNEWENYSSFKQQLSEKKELLQTMN